jgi:hypothetical protein
MLKSNRRRPYQILLIIFTLTLHSLVAHATGSFQVFDHGRQISINFENSTPSPINTVITLHRDSQNAIRQIEIAQSGKIITSGPALEINQVLASLTRDQTVAENLMVSVAQDFSFGIAPLDATGVRFSGLVSENKALKKIDLKVTQHLTSLWHAQVWSMTGYDMAFVLDGEKFLRYHEDLTSDSKSDVGVQEIFAFPAATGVYRSIKVESSPVECKGKIVKSNLEDVALHPFALCTDKLRKQ